MTVSQLQNADLTAKVISDGQVAENGKVSYTYKKKTFLWFSSKMSGVPTEPGTYTQTAKAGGNYSCGSISRTIAPDTLLGVPIRCFTIKLSTPV